jgi:excisionase family DNA binding protein
MSRPRKFKRHLPLRELLAGSDLITPEDLAPALKVARVTVYSWVRRKAIPHLKLEGSVRFEPESIKIWLESKRNEAKYSMI